MIVSVTRIASCIYGSVSRHKSKPSSRPTSAAWKQSQRSIHIVDSLHWTNIVSNIYLITHIFIVMVLMMSLYLHHEDHSGLWFKGIWSANYFYIQAILSTSSQTSFPFYSCLQRRSFGGEWAIHMQVLCCSEKCMQPFVKLNHPHLQRYWKTNQVYPLTAYYNPSLVQTKLQ